MRLFLFMLFILLLLIGSLQIPYFQTLAVNWTSEYLTKEIGYPISIKKVDISWFDEGVLEDIDLYDQDKKEFIHVEKAIIDFQISSLLDKDKILIDNVNLIAPRVYLDWSKEKGVLNVNTFVRAIKNSFKKKGKKKRKPKFRAFTVLNLNITNGFFSYHDNRKPHIDHNGFDHNYFELDSIYTSASDFYVHYDTIQLVSHKLRAREQNLNYHLKELNTLFRYTKKSLEFYDIEGFVEDSYLSDEIIMRYDTIIDLTDFNHKVDIQAKLDGSIIYTKDLAVFAPALKSFNDRWFLKGSFEGKVDDFKADNFTMKFGKNSTLNGKLSLKGLPKIAETFINIDLQKSTVDSRDLKRYLHKPKYYEVAKKFGIVNFSSDFVGFPKDFVAHGLFDTKMGVLQSDLKFEIRKEEAFSYYKGHLKSEDFNLKEFLNSKKLGLVNMDGIIEGNGFTIDDAKLKIKGIFDRFDFNNYSYKNIAVNAALEEGFISGDVDIDDTFLKVNSNHINIDFRDGKDSINVNAVVEKSYPQNLNFTKESSFFKGEIDVKTSGLDLDNLIGTANLKNAHIHNNGKFLVVDQFLLSSSKKDTIRDFNIQSDFGDFKAVGDFNFKTIVLDLKSLITETNLIFINNPEETSAHYANKIVNDNNYKINYELNAFNLNPLISLFSSDLYISPQSTIKGDFKHNKNVILNLYSNIDSLRFKEHSLKNNFLDLSFSKITDSTAVLASGTFKASKYYNKQKLTTSGISFESLWIDDSLTFNLGVKNPYNKDRANLNGNISFLEKEIIVSLFNSQLYLMNKSWTIQKGNEVRFGKDITFKNLRINNNQESIDLKGTISRNPDELLFLTATNFSLSTLDPITPIKFKGQFNGKVTLKDVFNKPTFFGDSEIKDLYLKNFYLGDLKGSFSWLKNTNILNSDLDLEYEGTKLAHVVGGLDLTSKTLDFKGSFQNAPLAFLEELLSGHATNITGKGFGKILLTGSVDDPKFNGAIDVRDGGFTVEYLKTHYKFNDEIYFKDNKIIADKLILTDTLFNTNGLLSGYIKHRLFKEFETNITLTLDETLALNTKSEDNKLYYGTAFGTGDINITGPFNKLKIQSKELKSEFGTKLYLPLEETEAVSSKDYIIFKQVETKKTVVKSTNDSKIDINLNFDINENAYFEIIFDEKAGDIIKGYGEGQIELQLDTKGDFNIYGTYQIKNGTYNFTLVNLINKRFYIDPGSVIKWNGDPYQGDLDIYAKYQLNTSLIPLVEDTAFVSSTPDARRREPVDVKMFLKGPLLTPQITFDIDILDYTNYIEMEQAVSEFNTQIQYNEQLLNNQVFSLMVLKQFAPLQQQNSFNLSAAGGNNLSELFSNQFSGWISQFDENLDVDIDLEGFDENSSSSFRLKLSYSILDGKIRVSRDGSFTNIDDQDQLANLFGEWTIEYLISKNGNLRIKAYNKTNQNSISTAIQNTSSQLYGASISHTTSFDSFKELFKKKTREEDIESSENKEFIKPEEVKTENETDSTNTTNPDEAIDSTTEENNK